MLTSHLLTGMILQVPSLKQTFKAFFQGASELLVLWLLVLAKRCNCPFPYRIPLGLVRISDVYMMQPTKSYLKLLSGELSLAQLIAVDSWTKIQL